MAPRPTVLDGNLTVADFIAQVALTHQYSTYPLVDPHGQLTGLVTLNRVRAVPPELRATTRLQDIACPPSEVPTARPEESLVELLERMNGCADGRAVVVDDAGRVVGVRPPATSPAHCSWPTCAPSIPIQHPLGPT